MQNYLHFTFELFIRLFCGIIFLFQGYDKLFKVKLNQVIDTFDDEAEKKNIPKLFVVFSAFYSSIVEFFGGIFLIVGLFKPIVLILLGFDLIMVAFAFSIIEAMWDMKHVFPRLALISALMLMPTEWEIVSIDYLIKLNFK
jgi:putative oxidoreductase